MTYKIHRDDEDVGKLFGQYGGQRSNQDEEIRLSPVIDPRQNILSLTDSASIQKNCGFDNICVPQLSIQHEM